MTLSSNREKQLSAYLHITIQHVQSAAVVHYVVVYEQQKHLVGSQRMSQNGPLIMFVFSCIVFLPLSCTFAISTVRLMPCFMLSQDNEAPLVSLNLQSPRKK